MSHMVVKEQEPTEHHFMKYTFNLGYESINLFVRGQVDHFFNLENPFRTL